MNKSLKKTISTILCGVLIMGMCLGAACTKAPESKKSSSKNKKKKEKKELTIEVETGTATEPAATTTAVTEPAAKLYKINEDYASNYGPMELDEDTKVLSSLIMSLADAHVSYWGEAHYEQNAVVYIHDYNDDGYLDVLINDTSCASLSTSYEDASGHVYTNWESFSGGAAGSLDMNQDPSGKYYIDHSFATASYASEDIIDISTYPATTVGSVIFEQGTLTQMDFPGSTYAYTDYGEACDAMRANLKLTFLNHPTPNISNAIYIDCDLDADLMNAIKDNLTDSPAMKHLGMYLDYCTDVNGDGIPDMRFRDINDVGINIESTSTGLLVYFE